MFIALHPTVVLFFIIMGVPLGSAMTACALNNTFHELEYRRVRILAFNDDEANKIIEENYRGRAILLSLGIITLFVVGSMIVG